MAASIVTSATFASFANTSTATASAGCGPCTYLQIYGTSHESVENPIDADLDLYAKQISGVEAGRKIPACPPFEPSNRSSTRRATRRARPRYATLAL